jgi:hypothetical protein
MKKIQESVRDSLSAVSINITAHDQSKIIAYDAGSVYGNHVERKDSATDDLRLQIDRVSSFDALFYDPLQGVVLHVT